MACPDLTGVPQPRVGRRRGDLQSKGIRMKAVIPAAGLGTRFLPATKGTPKELLPVLSKPVIQYVVEEALEP